MKICITCSAGGHLVEALQILPILKKQDIFFFTFIAPHLEKTLKKFRVYYVENPVRNPVLLIKLFLKSLFILFKEKPDVIISTGANVTVFVSILGKAFFKSKLIYVECAAQVFKPSLTGRILYYFSDLFFVQWKSLLKCYGKKAIYGGLLI
jgi:UDP-N-acetylglucosamine:LPS N-acetylglucosamine transferase